MPASRMFGHRVGAFDGFLVKPSGDTGPARSPTECPTNGVDANGLHKKSFHGRPPFLYFPPFGTFDHHPNDRSTTSSTRAQ